MWVKRSTRSELAALLAGNLADVPRSAWSSKGFPEEEIPGDDLYLIWESEAEWDGELPPLLLIGEGRLRDFLAWAWTYLPGYRPFTAYFRVLESPTAFLLEKRMPSPSLRGIESACAGLVLGESLMLAGDQKAFDSLSVVACASTLTYTLAKALSVGARKDELETVSNLWSAARKSAGETARKVDVGVITRIMRVLGLLRYGIHWDSTSKSQSDLLIVEACKELQETGRISAPLWSSLTSDSQELKQAQERMEGPREDRVRQFQQYASEGKLRSGQDDLSEAFLYGYMASLIGPGSMRHFELLFRYSNEVPATLLWYGLCAGLHKKTDILGSFEALGRRLLRDLCFPESIFVPPTADISVSELQVLMSDEAKPIDFRSFSPGHIGVELTPLVKSYVHGLKSVRPSQVDMFTDTGYQIAHELLEELGSYLDKSVEIHGSLLDVISRPHQSSKGPPRGKRIVPRHRKR